MTVEQKEKRKNRKKAHMRNVFEASCASSLVRQITAMYTKGNVCV